MSPGSFEFSKWLPSYEVRGNFHFLECSKNIYARVLEGEAQEVEEVSRGKMPRGSSQ